MHWQKLCIDRSDRVEMNNYFYTAKSSNSKKCTHLNWLGALFFMSDSLTTAICFALSNHKDETVLNYSYTRDDSLRWVQNFYPQKNISAVFSSQSPLRYKPTAQNCSNRIKTRSKQPKLCLFHSFSAQESQLNTKKSFKHCINT